MALKNSARIGVGEANAFRQTMTAYLDEYNKNVTIVMQQAIDEVGKDAVKMLKKNSPKGKTGKYGKGWTYKKADSKRAQYKADIYNKNKPGVAHLLENGHEVLDINYDSHGYTKPKVHILPVDEWVEQELPKRISQKIQ